MLWECHVLVERYHEHVKQCEFKCNSAQGWHSLIHSDKAGTSCCVCKIGNVKELLHTLQENNANWSWHGTGSVGFFKSALFSISTKGHDQASEKESGDNGGMSFACRPKNQWTNTLPSSRAMAAGSSFETEWINVQLNNWDFLRTFEKLQKVTISFIMSVCPSAWNNSAPTGCIFMQFDNWGFFKNPLRKFKGD
jgi:hypothetical protein